MYKAMYKLQNKFWSKFTLQHTEYTSYRIDIGSNVLVNNAFLMFCLNIDIVPLVFKTWSILFQMKTPLNLKVLQVFEDDEKGTCNKYDCLVK